MEAMQERALIEILGRLSKVLSRSQDISIMLKNTREAVFGQLPPAPAEGPLANPMPVPDQGDIAAIHRLILEVEVSLDRIEVSTKRLSAL